MVLGRKRPQGEEDVPRSEAETRVGWRRPFSIVRGGWCSLRGAIQS
jgi:hypothetical protein